MACASPGGGARSKQRRRPSRPRRRRVGEALAAFAQEIFALENCAAAECEAPALDSPAEPPSPPQEQAVPAPPGADGPPADAPLGAAARSQSLLDEDQAVQASVAIRAMARDNAVMQQSIGDYDAVLRAVLAEVRILRAKASHMKRVCAQAVDLQSALASEVQEQEALRREGAELSARNAELLCLVRDALDADGDVERSAFADALAAENAMLWRLVHASRYANLMSSTAVQAIPPLARKQRLSLSSRSRASSGVSSASTPSRASGGGGSESPARRVLAFAHDSPPPQPAAASTARAADASAAGSTPAAEGDHAAPRSAGAASELAVGLEGSLDEDDLSEVSSLVESAIFLGGPAAEAEGQAEQPTPPPGSSSSADAAAAEEGAGAEACQSGAEHGGDPELEEQAGPADPP